MGRARGRRDRPSARQRARLHHRGGRRRAVRVRFRRPERGRRVRRRPMDRRGGRHMGPRRRDTDTIMLFAATALGRASRPTSSRSGRNCSATAIPRRSLRPVRSSASQVTASVCSQVPTLEITWPTKYRRKLRCWKAAKRSSRVPANQHRSADCNRADGPAADDRCVAHAGQRSGEGRWRISRRAGAQQAVGGGERQ